MPAKHKAPYSAGHLWPSIGRVRLCGHPFRVRQLRVRDVGALERRLEAIGGHPRRDMVAHEAAIAAARASGDAGAFQAAYRAVERLLDGWPPRLGSARMGALLATPRGLLEYLALALGRTERHLTLRHYARLLRRMTAADWSRLDAALWGRGRWEAPTPEDATPGPADGIDWGERVRWLTRDGRMTIAEVGELYVAQFFFLTQAPDASGRVRRDLWIADQAGEG